MVEAKCVLKTGESISTGLVSKWNFQRIGRLLACATLITTFFAVTTSRTANGWTTNPTQALVFSGFMGNAEGIGESIVRTDVAENVYVTGWSGGTAEFNNASPTLRLGNGDDWSNHLLKYSREGQFVWKAEWFITAGDIRFLDMEISSTGDVYLAGYAQSGADADPGAATRSITSSGSNGVVVKIDSNGAFQWVREFPATQSVVRDLAIRPDGSFVVGGIFRGTLNLNGTGGPGGVSVTSSGLSDAFVASFSSSGVEQWVVRGSSSNDDDVTSVDVTSSGDVVATGWTNGTLTLGSTNGSTTTVTTSGSFLGNMVWKINSAGVTQWGMTPVSTPTASTVDPRVLAKSDGSVVVATNLGDIYSITSSGVLASSFAIGATILTITELTSQHIVYGGFFQNTVDLDPSSGTDSKTATTGTADGFITTLTPSLGYVSSRIFDGPVTQEIQSIESMSNGGFIMTGRTFNTAPLSLSVPSDGSTFSAAAGADSLRFVVRYNRDGTTASSTTTIPAPAAPTAVSYTTGNGKVRIKWTGDSVSARYEVLSSTGKKLCETTSTSCLISKLKNGTVYRMSVQALNAESKVSTATRVVVIPGFTLKKYSYVAKQKPLLSSIMTTPSTGRKSWTVVSGSCRISAGRLLTPAKKATCKIRLGVARTSKYPAMAATVTVTVTK